MCRNPRKGGTFASLLGDAHDEVCKERQVNTMHADARFARNFAEKERVAEERARKMQEEEDMEEAKRAHDTFEEDHRRQIRDSRIAARIEEEETKMEEIRFKNMERQAQEDERAAKMADEEEEVARQQWLKEHAEEGEKMARV